MRLLFAFLVLLPSFVDAAVPSKCEPYRRAITGAAYQQFGVNAPVASIAANIEQESSCKDSAKSKYAGGLCQFTEKTAHGLALQYQDLRPPIIWSSDWCLKAMVRLLRDEMAKFQDGRTECTSALMAQAAYNGGPETLRVEIAQCKATPGCDPTLWYYNVDEQRSRGRLSGDRLIAQRGLPQWEENRAYTVGIFRREAAYVTAGWGRSWCR